MRIFAAIIFSFLLASSTFAAEVMPHEPTDYVNDYAGVMSAATVKQLSNELGQFERETSNQIFVAIYPKMQSDSSIEDYTIRVAQSWKVGQKVKKNGIVLFVFVQDRKAYIQVGYGLEGALPDATAAEIIDQQLKPKFRANDYNGGVTDAVHSMMAATKGEYKGSGASASDRVASGTPVWVLPLALFVGWIVLRAMFRRGTVYSGAGRSSSGFWIGLAAASLFNSSGGGGGFGGGGFGGGGGSGFSGGGGGSFGGGGAGGSW